MIQPIPTDQPEELELALIEDFEEEAEYCDDCARKLPPPEVVEKDSGYMELIIECPCGALYTIK